MRLLLMILTVTFLSLTGVIVWLTRGQMDEVASLSNLSPAAGQAQIGGDFTLTDQNGREVHDKDFRGRVMLVYFGFTHCPDICAVAMQSMTDALDLLKGQAAEVTPIFVSVDPERDTPESLTEFVRPFHPSFVALTGTQEQVDAVQDAYKVYASKVEGNDKDNYLVDHSGFIYLMGKDGTYITHFSSDQSPQAIADAIKSAL